MMIETNTIRNSRLSAVSFLFAFLGSRGSVVYIVLFMFLSLEHIFPRVFLIK